MRPDLLPRPLSRRPPGNAVDLGAGCREAADTSERAFPASPWSGRQAEEGPNRSQASQPEPIGGNSSRKDKGVERLVMRLYKSAALEAK